MGSAQRSIVVAGHICLDIIPTLSRAATIEPGRLMRIGPAMVSTGGAVANTGLALHRLGAPVRLMGKVGDDIFGQAILQILRGHGEDLAAGMIIAPGEATSYSIVISPPGIDRSFWHCPGANDTYCAADLRFDRLAGASIFHFGYPPVMRRFYSDGGEQLHDMFHRVREVGLATSLDLCQPDAQSEAGAVDWTKLLGRVLPAVDLFCPSIDELSFMLDRPAFDLAGRGDSPAGAHIGPMLRRLGDAALGMGTSIVLLKCGERGLYLRTSNDMKRIGDFCKRLGLDADRWIDRELHSPCFCANQVAGTTGSGDCTIAGFLAALLRREDPAAAATAACAVGACSVEAADATGGVPAWSVVSERLRNGWTRHPAEIDWGSDRQEQTDQAGIIHLKHGRSQ